MVKGLAELNRRWGGIPEAVRINTRAAMEDIATDLVEEMWARAPHGATGVLSASIGWTWGEAPAGTLVIGSVGGRDYGTMRITIFAGGGEAFYARFHEFGTSRMPARPFFYPVWRARRRNARARLARAIGRTIRESK